MTLEEHHKNIQAAIDAAKSDGFWVTAKTCCCGEGLIIEFPMKDGQYGDSAAFDLD